MKPQQYKMPIFKFWEYTTTDALTLKCTITVTYWLILPIAENPQLYKMYIFNFWEYITTDDDLYWDVLLLLLQPIAAKPQQYNFVSSLNSEKFKFKTLLVEFMYLVFTRMPGESYRRQLGSLCCCTYFERYLTPLCVAFNSESTSQQRHWRWDVLLLLLHLIVENRQQYKIYIFLFWEYTTTDAHKCWDVLLPLLQPTAENPQQYSFSSLNSKRCHN